MACGRGWDRLAPPFGEAAAPVPAPCQVPRGGPRLTPGLMKMGADDAGRGESGVRESELPPTCRLTVLCHREVRPHPQAAWTASREQDWPRGVHTGEHATHVAAASPCSGRRGAGVKARGPCGGCSLVRPPGRGPVHRA